MRNKTLDLFAINFNEIDLKKCDWMVETKEQAIEEIKKKDYMSGWIIVEVMN